MTSGLPSLQQQLDRVRDMQGRDPLPSGSQSPFSANEPPPPLPDYIPAGHQVNDPDVPDDWLDPEMDPTARIARGLPMPSPLIPKEVAKPAPPMDLSNPVSVLLESGLVVIGRLGAWKGREVQLSEATERKIRALVISAIRQEIDADLAEASGKRPRRPRMPAQPSAEVPRETTPKRRGRPRGSLLARQ